jgi:hypothetical protein
MVRLPHKQKPREYAVEVGTVTVIGAGNRDLVMWCARVVYLKTGAYCQYVLETSKYPIVDFINRHADTDAGVTQLVVQAVRDDLDLTSVQGEGQVV